MNHFTRFSDGQRHVQGTDHQIGCHLLTEGPAYYLAAEYINDHSQIQKSCPNGNVSHVRNPQLIDACRFKMALYQVRRRMTVLVPMGCNHKTTPAAYSPDPHFAHQSAHALVISQNSQIGQFSGNARTSVSKITGTVNRQNLLD